MSVQAYEYVSAWRPKEAEVPACASGSLQLGCVYKLNFGIDTVDEAVHFRRDSVYDELWVEDPFGHIVWLGVRMKRQRRSRRASCLAMLERLVRARAGYAGPDAVRVPGLIGAADLEALNAKLHAERMAARQAADAWRSTPIICVATELGLSPCPSGGKPTSWEARCPGTNHPLRIEAKSEVWGCGWCRRKGGIEELRQFAEERRSGWR